MHACPASTGPVPHVGGPVLPPGAPTVLIGGLPAARMGDMAVCKLPAARMGDSTAHGGTIAAGFPTVNIGG